MARCNKTFIGRSVTWEGIRFIAVLGEFAYGSREYYFVDNASTIQQPECFKQEIDFEDWRSWWAKARMLALFGIHAPTSPCMTLPLEFQLGVLPESATAVEMVRPLLVQSSPECATFFVRCGHRETEAGARRIVNAFFGLLVTEPSHLGIFSDYYVRLWDSAEINAPSSHDVALHRVSCDGIDFILNFIGYLRPQDVSDDEIDQINLDTQESSDMVWVREVPIWPFKMPIMNQRKRQNRLVRRRMA